MCKWEWILWWTERVSYKGQFADESKSKKMLWLILQSFSGLKMAPCTAQSELLHQVQLPRIGKRSVYPMILHHMISYKGSVIFLKIIQILGNYPKKYKYRDRSVPSIRTSETLVRQSRARQLNHSAVGLAPASGLLYFLFSFYHSSWGWFSFALQDAAQWWLLLWGIFPRVSSLGTFSLNFQPPGYDFCHNPHNIVLLLSVFLSIWTGNLDHLFSFLFLFDIWWVCGRYWVNVYWMDKWTHFPFISLSLSFFFSTKLPPSLRP